MDINSNIYSGLWKFKDSIEESQLVELAKEWAKDNKYIHLYIRRCSKDQHGIGFSYLNPNKATEEAFDNFTDEMKDVLYKRFGTGLVGWDLSSSTTTIKGF